MKVLIFALKKLRFDFDIDALLKCFDVKSLREYDDFVYHLITWKSVYLSECKIPTALVNELILYGEDEVFLQQKDFNILEAIYFSVVLNKINLLVKLVNESNVDYALPIAVYYHRQVIVNYLQETYSNVVRIEYTEIEPVLPKIILCHADDLFREYLIKDLNIFYERRSVGSTIFSYLRDNEVSLMEYVIGYRYISGLKIMIDLGCPINHNSFHFACQIKAVEIIRILLIHAEDLPKFTERFILQYLSKSDFNLYCRFLS